LPSKFMVKFFKVWISKFIIWYFYLHNNIWRNSRCSCRLECKFQSCVCVFFWSKPIRWVPYTKVVLKKTNDRLYCHDSVCCEELGNKYVSQTRVYQCSKSLAKNWMMAMDLFDCRYYLGEALMTLFMKPQISQGYEYLIWCSNDINWYCRVL
jgi:hypothetical protein